MLQDLQRLLRFSPVIMVTPLLLGYISGNVRVISKRANLLKKDATIEELMGILNYMKTAIAAKPVTHYEVQQ